ncbi:hypothetical protein KRR40_44990 [Niabella defluvii]|nr:hypothetical protein KRR40_44990 [Niabella sp. I65]
MPEGPGASANELAMYEEVIKQMRNGERTSTNGSMANQINCFLFTRK